MRGLAEVLLDQLHHPGALGTVKPALHRLIGFQAEDRDPFVLQAGHWAEYFGTDESRKPARGIGKRVLRQAEFADFVRQYPMRRDGGRRLRSFEIKRLS